MSPTTLAAMIVWLVAAIAGSMLALTTGPVLEGTFAPILDHTQTVSNVRREDDRVCWDWSFTKLRQATPDAAGWFLTVDGKISVIPLAVVTPQSERLATPPRERPVGPGRQRLCALMPLGVDLPPRTTIVGRIHYNVNHDLWRVVHEVPPVKVPPLTP